MTSQLATVPAGTRRRLGAVVAVFAVLFAAIGAVSLTGSGAIAVIFAVLGFVTAVPLALIAWGLVHSVSLEAAEQALDRELEAAVVASGGSMCGCGHDHDPDELHVSDACEHDGTGAACEHNCDTCVLAGLRAK